ncbi:MAG: ribosome maturation factor RimP [Gemmatimonadetes bacterium]|nr:ribosome maturation factor RimP [Gemmatimonadota bacterium]
MLEREALERELASRVEELGYEPVEVRHGGTARRPHLTVRIDRPGSEPGHGVTVDDCARVSRALEAWLDGRGVGEGRYILEVSSPGLDRPLRRLAEWKRFMGRPVDVLVPQLGGRFRVTATQTYDEPEPAVELQFPKGVRRVLTLAEIKEARLGFDW